VPRPFTLLACILATCWAMPAAGEEPPGPADLDRLLEEDRWEEALPAARRARRACGGCPEMAAVLGRALFRAGRPAEAEALLEPLAGSEKVSARALITLGRIRVASGRADEAYALGLRARAAAPDDPEVLFWAPEMTATRTEAAELLERYLAVAAGQSPDRVKAARGTVGLYRELGERAVWIPAGRPERAEIPLKPFWDMPGRIAGYMIEVLLGEHPKPLRLLLDTGSPGLFVIRRKARKHGFDPLSEETAFGGGGRRRHPTRRGVFSSFAAGPLRYTDALASTTKGEVDPQGRFHGLVGLSIFQGYRVTLDLPGEKILLGPPGEDEPGSPYWTVAGQLLVEVTMPDGSSPLLIFDTGARGSVISTRLASRIEGTRPAGQADVRGFGGRVEDARAVRGVRLEFQGLSNPDPVMNALDLSLRSFMSGVEVSGFLGMDILEGSRIVIDTSRQRVSVRRAR
jgi:hypothetical protein